MFKKTISIYIAVFALSFSMNSYAENLDQTVLSLKKSTSNSDQDNLVFASGHFASVGGSKEAARHLMTVLGESIAPPDPTGDLRSPENQEIVKTRISSSGTRNKALRNLLAIMSENKDLVTEADLERLRRTAQYDFGDKNRGYATAGYALLEPNPQKAREFLRQVQSSDGKKVFDGEYTLDYGVQSRVLTGLNSENEPLYDISWRVEGEGENRDLGSKRYVRLKGTRAEIKQQALEHMDTVIADLKSKGERIRQSPTARDQERAKHELQELKWKLDDCKIQGIKCGKVNLLRLMVDVKRAEEGIPAIRYRAILDRIAELEAQKKLFAENESVIPYGASHLCLGGDVLANKVEIADMMNNRSRARYMSENLDQVRKLPLRSTVQRSLAPLLPDSEKVWKRYKPYGSYVFNAGLGDDLKGFAEECEDSLHNRFVKKFTNPAKAQVVSSQSTNGTAN